MEADYEEKRPFLINKLETLQKFYKEQPKLEREIKFAFPKYVDAEDKVYEDAAQRLINQASAADTFNSVFLNKLKPKYNPARLGDQNPPQENGNIQEDKKPAHVLPKDVKVGSQVPSREERKVEEPVIQQRVPGKELKIVITISNPEFYDKVTKIQQDSEGKPVKYDFDLVMKKALLHLKHFVNNNLAENYYKINKAEQETLLFTTFKAKPHFSGANKDVELLPDGFEYQLLPKSIEIKAYTTDPLDLKEDNMNPKVEVKRGNQALSDYEKQQEPLLLKRFDRFLRYFQGLPYTLLDRNDLKEAVEKTIKKFFGIREFMDKFLIELNQFTSPWFSAPKGILLYGPPGTGKSAITKALCEELGVVFATAPMAAGDLKKGIVGDSEKTVNAIAQRAKLIPWEMIVALIDEIDSLAPDRNGQNSSSGSEDLIGVLLATMDGSKETKNLKIIASTNLLNKIDAAFLRRMEIQLFLGNPNKESRKQWIESKAVLCYKDPKAYRVKDFLNRADLKDLREKITDTTINFSADSFRKLLDRYYHALLSLDNEPTIKDYTRLLYEKIKGVSQEMKIVLAGTPIIDIFEQTEDLKGMYSPPAIADFHALCAADNHEKVSRKVLVDLSSDNPNEIFQIHCGSDKTMTETQSDIYRELEIVYDDAIDDPDSKALTFYHYLYAILVFKNVKHVAHSPEETQKLNGIRGRLLSFANIDKFEGLRKERVTKLHNVLEKYHTIDPKLFELWKSFSANASYMFYNMLNSISAFYSQSDDLKTFSLLEKKNIQMYQKCWLPLILQFSLAYNADITKLIDNNFIVNNNANDDTAAMALVNSVVEETKKYGRAVVIFDLDSIAQLRKEYQSLKEDIKSASLVALQGGDNASSFSYVMQRPLTFNFVLDLIKILNPNGSCWFFAVSNHKKLTLDFKEALKWPQTDSEKEYERKEEEKEIPYRCSRCKEIFTERENAFEYKCGRHKESTLVYENPNKDKDKKNQKPEIVDLATAQLMIRVTKDAFPWQFKYTCCGGAYDSKGELPCQHKKGERFNYDE